jgi:hypothetical protein
VRVRGKNRRRLYDKHYIYPVYRFKPIDMREDRDYPTVSLETGPVLLPPIFESAFRSRGIWTQSVLLEGDMAVKHEFHSESKSSDSRPKISLQNQASSTNKKSEAIDSLVSNFLAELADLSSEVNRAVDPAKTPGPASGANEFRMLPHVTLQEGVRSEPDLDLERIDDEIERSLIELENLGSEGGSKPNAQPEAIPAATDSRNEAAALDTSSPASKDPGVQFGNQPKLFRGSISFYKPAPQRRIELWILAGLVLAGTLFFLAYYLFSSNESASIGSSPASVSEPDGRRREHPQQSANIRQFYSAVK